jgi:hypothetical protein
LLSGKGWSGGFEGSGSDTHTSKRRDSRGSEALQQQQQQQQHAGKWRQQRLQAGNLSAKVVCVAR